MQNPTKLKCQFSLAGFFLLLNEAASCEQGERSKIIKLQNCEKIAFGEHAALRAYASWRTMCLSAMSSRIIANDQSVSRIANSSAMQ